MKQLSHCWPIYIYIYIYMRRQARERVTKVRAKKRIGKLDFISCMQKALEKHYGDRLVGLGGMFEMKNGKVKQHIMPNFLDTPLTSEAQLNNWLRFYEMETPLIAVGTFVSVETDLDLRVQHFHSSFEENRLGGHYHFDTTSDTIEYTRATSMWQLRYMSINRLINCSLGKINFVLQIFFSQQIELYQITLCQNIATKDVDII